MNSKTLSSPLVVALDVATHSAALNLARQLDPQICRLKVGKELFTAAGPKVLEDLHALGFEVFLDLKFHDIPETVAKAVKVAADLGVWMVNVHASGGSKMLAAAADILAQYRQKPLLIGVTVLTSFGPQDFAEVGGLGALHDQVSRLAQLVYGAGLDGVVCSAQEVKRLKLETSAKFLTVTPGIRPVGAASQDQVRVMTPTAALEQGSDYLVMGRPITDALNPAAACAQIAQEIAGFSLNRVTLI